MGPSQRAAVARELAEYAQADAIFVPSHYVRDTFLGEGVPAEKVRLVPYGVNTSAFRPTASPPEQFRALFAGGLSARKGIHYLLRAWRIWGHPSAQLRLAGAPSAEFDHLVRWAGGLPPNVTLLGHLPREALVREMSSAHVLVLPSIEEGLALVQAQAMACGAAVIASTNTGAATLFDHGKEGLIGPIRSTDFLVEAFERLSTDRELLARMRASALARSAAFGSVEAYGDRVAAALEALVGARRAG